MQAHWYIQEYLTLFKGTETTISPETVTFGHCTPINTVEIIVTVNNVICELL